MTAEELDEYFTGDKSNWYTLESGKKKWDVDKVSQFWIHIREKKDNDFSFYKFPRFEYVDPNVKGEECLKKDENFWKKGENREFKVEANFIGSKFIGEANFCFVKFTEKVDFGSTEFAEKVDFSKSQFIKDVNFTQVKFSEFVNFKEANFTGETNFTLSQIERVDFDKSTFTKMAIFFGARFINDVIFSECQFLEEVNFRDVFFIKRADFNNIVFNDHSTILFEGLIYGPDLSFVNVKFPRTVIFRSVNLTNSSFINSDLTDVQFKECNWGKTVRIILKEEKEGGEYYEGMEGIYRQLKRKFDSNKNWELSGKAYRSEMLMRRYRLHNSFKKTFWFFNHDFYEWFIYWIYGRCSGFTQSILTPLFLIVFMIFGFATIYYLDCLNTYTNVWDCNYMESFQYTSILDSLQRSLAAALPVFKTDLIYSSWWIKSFESLVCSILLVFFILSLRKRFKQ